MLKTHIPGILVIPARANFQNSMAISFTFILSSNSPANPLFFTSPKLRQAIADLKNSARHLSPVAQVYADLYERKVPIGEISYIYLGQEIVKGKRRNVYEEFINQFANIQFSNVFELFSQKGIGGGMEKIALREFRKLAGNALIVPGHNTVSYARRQRLEQRKIKVNDVHLSITHGLDFPRQEPAYMVSAKKMEESIKMKTREFKKLHKKQKTPGEIVDFLQKHSKPDDLVKFRRKHRAA